MAILSPEGQVEDSGCARQRRQTGQIGRTSHCWWTGHKQDIQHHSWKGQKEDMQDRKDEKDGDRSIKLNLNKSSQSPSCQLTDTYLKLGDFYEESCGIRRKAATAAI